MKIFKNILVIYIGCTLIISCAAEDNPATEKPNILLIVGDDHGYADLSVAGLANDVNTPNLDRLAEKGVRFTQSYATSPICNISRGGLISGTYTQRSGNYWYGGNGIEDIPSKTLPEALKEVGYSTGYIGKFHYGKNSSPTSRNFPTNHGFDHFYGFSGGRKHYLIHKASAEEDFQTMRKEHKKSGESLEMGAVWIDTAKVDQEGFSTELIGNHAREFLDDNGDKPFFLQVGFNAIHNFTHQLPEDYLNEKGLKGYHDWDPATENFRDWYVGGRYPNNPEGRAYYLGQLHFLDVEVGRLLDYLEEKNLAKNTIVIYIGDNGGSTPIYANNGPLRGSKYTLYEGGIRVPLMIYGPQKYLQGQVVEQVVSAMDIYPTILKAVGIKVPESLDGKDISQILITENAAPNVRPLFWDTGHEIAVREGRWKYKAAFDKKYAIRQMVSLELGEALYDLDADIGETNNLADQYPEVMNDLKKKFKHWAEENQPVTKLSSAGRKLRDRILNDE